MKKQLLTVIAVFASAITFAQNYYNFTTSTATYADLTGATSVNSNTIWEWNEFGPFTLPLNVTAFGSSGNQLKFFDDSFIINYGGEFDNISFGTTYMYVRDRNNLDTGNSLSPLSYKIEGTAPNRILKMEMKNVGFEDELVNNETTDIFANMQVWYYESNQAIEYRYGSHNITTANFATISNGEPNYVIVMRESELDMDAGVVNSNANVLSYQELDETAETPPVGLNFFPAPNTVYRFEVNPLAIQDQEKVDFSIFPNPVQNQLTVNLPENIKKKYSVYDMMGREVLFGETANNQSITISTENLSVGSYFIKIGATTQKFVKK